MVENALGCIVGMQLLKISAVPDAATQSQVCQQCGKSHLVRVLQPFPDIPPTYVQAE